MPFIGIDVAKAQLEFAVLPTAETGTVANEESGIRPWWPAPGTGPNADRVRGHRRLRGRPRRRLGRGGTARGGRQSAPGAGLCPGDGAARQDGCAGCTSARSAWADSMSAPPHRGCPRPAVPPALLRTVTYVFGLNCHPCPGLFTEPERHFYGEPAVTRDESHRAGSAHQLAPLLRRARHSP